ncbi:MAG: isoleucine--tRNA ligase [Crocinitomicaceae bacterium]|nr:isoleucine--tRNA ligase [Crocinitomicaceae bacterium]|tara:strand:- start:54829 stop:58245 length:3417 start_codon:yes stop_codon:yes gene_type:complete
MNKKYPTYKGLNLPNIASRIGEMWGENKVFDKSVSNREGREQFVFFEGPPSANGLPGIHHVMGRSIKDIFCRYKTLKGFQVKRRAGWDTHGLPVELGVEKSLNITKEDIGKKISIENYNKACKEDVMRYTDIWNSLTSKMGYWVDMDNPYITYESKYIESVWWLIAQLYSKNMIYKGYTVQPYSPKAGTGLSTHELNQPGCYKDVTDTTVVAQFKMKDGQINPFGLKQEIYFLAWTTTPWTLPSNTALTVGPNIDYVLVKTFNQYTYKSINVVLAKSLVNSQFSKFYRLVDDESELSYYKNGDKTIPYFIYDVCRGKDLVGLKYDQLLPYALPYKSVDKAFKIISGDFVTTEDGTGIVHTAPTFGADDARVAEAAGVPGLLVLDDKENPTPLVDLQGKFTHHMKEFAGFYVKNEYYDDGSAPEKSVDVQIAIKLKTENKAFKVEKYVHSYPHCWRTDKPILYYPLDSWFVKAKQNKTRMMELNKTINWTPKATGVGRFGKWLENLNDWNLSRSRYWGIPIPIWSTLDGSERICISSIEELKKECERSVDAGLMKVNPLADFKVGDMSESNYLKVDLHKNHMDQIILLSSSGLPMRRESDLIDVWFDSGAMPYAQWHYPFENSELINNKIGYPADFIAEGVDQTRGWFYTLHAISTMVFDNVAFKNVLSNGLVLDKNGQKMSKRLGNAVDPFITIDKYGPDATRWYMITNAQPWDNLKFDEDGILEVQRKFFGTLYNTYSFFALYANIDNFNYNSSDIRHEERPEIDRWILSKLNSLIKEVDKAFSLYDATKSGRLIQSFVIEHLSNWYVRLCRRRYWKQSNGESLAEKDKLSAYQTLYKCLETVSIIAAPIAPFFMDQLFLDLNTVSKKSKLNSVHLFNFPEIQESFIDLKLEAQMDIAQKISSLVLGLRKKEKIRVRQPLNKIMIPVLDSEFENNVLHVKDLILSEVNVKDIELLKEDNSVFVKSIKPNFKTIGPKYGKHMKAISNIIAEMTKEDISFIESNKFWSKEIDGELIELDISDFEISARDIPGWLVKSENGLTVALDVKVTDELRAEGIARELVNRIQNFRKDSGLEITDKITLKLDTNEFIKNAIKQNKRYVCNEVLANDILFEKLDNNSFKTNIVEQDDVRLILLKNK